MSDVEAYRFKLYDIHQDNFQESRRWAILEVINRLHGEVVKDSEILVDQSDINSDIPGMTHLGFQPKKQSGFQRQVMS